MTEREKQIEDFMQRVEPDAYKYVVKKTIHYDHEIGLLSYIEEDMRRELLLRLAGRIFSGGPYVVEVTREVSEIMSDGYEVKYIANIREVKKVEVTPPRRNYKPWEREPLTYQSTGKNHRKKDRARARYRRKQREKLRMIICDKETHKIMHQRSMEVK